MTDSTVGVFCTECGQALSAPVGDLRAVVQCPRCQTRHSLESLVPREKALPAPIVEQVAGPAPPPNIADAPPSIALDATVPASSLAFAPATQPPEPAGRPLEPSTVQPPAPSGRLARGAVVAAREIDARLRGRRRWVLLVGAALVEATLEWWRDWYVLALPLFAFVCWGLIIAKVWSVRDDQDNWTWTYLWIRAKATMRGAAQGALELGPVRDWPRRAALPLLTIGLLMVVVAEPSQALIRYLAGRGSELGGWAGDVVEAGWIAVGVALFNLFLAFRRGRGAKVRAAIADLAAGGKAVTFSGFAPIVDVWEVDRTALSSLKGVGEVIATLKDWKPRRCQYEADYEASLVRHLRRRLPDVPVDNQYPIRNAAGQLVGKIDVVLGDLLAIELKRAVRTSEADRAVGQIWKYLDNWTKGPVMLLLCETTASFAEAGMADRIDHLRRQGKSVLVVAAGTRRAG